MNDAEIIDLAKACGLPVGSWPYPDASEGVLKFAQALIARARDEALEAAASLEVHVSTGFVDPEKDADMAGHAVWCYRQEILELKNKES